VISFTPLPLYPQGKSPWYPLDRRIGGPQSLPGGGGEEKNSQALLGIEPLIIQLVAQSYTTELTHQPSVPQPKTNDKLLLTLWSRALIEELVVAYEVKKFSSLYGIQNLITASFKVFK
jgi:hypothetical protein